MSKVNKNSESEKEGMLPGRYPIFFYAEVAEQIGLRESIFLNQLHYWLQTSGKTKEGRRWIYNRFTDWANQLRFPVPTLKRVVQLLRDQNLILTANFNKNPIDKTLWYSINYDQFYQLFPKDKNDTSKDTFDTSKDKNDTKESSKISIEGSERYVQGIKMIPPITNNYTSTTTSTNSKENNAENKISASGNSEIIDFDNENADNNETSHSISPGKKEKKGRRPRKSVEPLHTPLKGIFLRKYQADTELSYYWTAADGKNLNALIAKIKKTFEDQGKEIIREGVADFFLLMLDRLPPWIKEKAYSMQVINSKYNEVLNQLKNGKSNPNRKFDKQRVLDEISRLEELQGF